MSSRANLSRSDALWIRCHGKDLAGLPEPSKTWQWRDVSLSHKQLCALMHRDLIVKTGDGWRTDARLYDRLEEEGWLDVIDAPCDGGQSHFASFVAPE